MSDELVPVVIVDELTQWPQRATGIRRYWYGMNTGAVAQSGFLVIRNPINSTAYVVVEQAFSHDALGVRYWTKGTGVITGTAIVNSFGNPIDEGIASAAATNPGQAQFFRDDQPTAASDSSAIGFFMGSTAPVLVLGIVLGKDQWLAVYGATAATQSSVAVRISEFDFQP
jgi:hypothetical protein